MGYYIEVEHHLNKTQQLLEMPGVTTTTKPSHIKEVPPDKFLLCVVQNGLFDAAGIVYDQLELEVFSSADDLRHRDWLLMPVDMVFELNPRFAEWYERWAK